MRLGVAGREYRHLADHILGDYRRAIRRWHTLMGSLTEELVKIDQAPDHLRWERSVMPGVSCKTIFNNELWTSKRPL
jgi:hypothetical protein